MSWFSRIRPGNPSVPTLRGGLALPRNKPGLSADGSIVSLPVPRILTIPLKNYHNEFVDAHVTIGQSVELGESIADGILASARGSIIAIEERPVIHPSFRKSPCIVLQTDPSVHDEVAVHAPEQTLTLDRIKACGIQGLGGAGYPTANKIQALLTHELAVDTLIINAVECEPLISCDEALMLNQPANIIQGIMALVKMSQCRRCVLAIENDKPACIAAIRASIEHLQAAEFIQLTTLTPVYPSGAERPLVERITGHRLTPGSYPSDLGVICINIATSLAAWRAQQGYALTSRIVTIAGEMAQKPTNVRVRFGTSVAEVLKQTGNHLAADKHRIRVGGPLSGFDLQSTDVPVTATTNCISIESQRKTVPVNACIRCSACDDICPVDLLPQQLYWYAKQEKIVEAARYHLSDCLECGCCDVVCPSNIPLTQTFRFAKGVQREQLRQTILAEESQQRFLQRDERNALREKLREQKRQAARTRLEERDDPIAEALARSRQRRKATNNTPEPITPKSFASNPEPTASSDANGTDQ